MSTLLRSECIRCLTEKQLSSLPKDAREEQKLEFLQKMCGILSAAPRDVCSPVILHQINELRREIFGSVHDYAEEKSYYNHLLLKKEQGIREKIHAAEDSLLTAMQFSLVGNYIDFSAVENVEEEYLEKLLKEVEKSCVTGDAWDRLKHDLGSLRNLLFLTDNAGEGVLDKLFLEVIREYYPHLNVKVMVRGESVLNDMTMEDATEIGLQDVAEVYDNGNGIAGTWLPELSPQAKTIWEEADVIIAKGQGNYETLRLCGENIYFIFLCKCEMFCRNFQVPQYTGVMVHGEDEKRK
ncbi:MAG: ARMT1-like domain-containing protein [Lachnospiraceae bacterium]|nr:ARMT1-like domain-containing protein [Lachnospiraceae bacterium]